MESVEVREQLVDALRLDLVGPEKGCELEDEILPQAPSRWYLTGFLVPLEAGEEQRADETFEEEVDELDEVGGTDDTDTPEPAAAKRAFFPSSIGMSLLVPRDTRQAMVTVRWGDYKQEIKNAEIEKEDDSGVEDVTRYPATKSSDSGDKDRGNDSNEKGSKSRSFPVWKRTPREVEVALVLPNKTDKSIEHEVPGSDGLKLVISVRPVPSSETTAGKIPEGVRSVSIFLVNKRRPAPDDIRDEGFAFQAELDVEVDSPLVSRPNLRGLETDDWDERVADLQYREAFEFAVGHGVSTQVILDPDGGCRRVMTRWIPSAEVERVDPAEIEEVELSMERLAELASGADASEKLSALTAKYRDWIEKQRLKMPNDPPSRVETADELLRRAGTAADRIDAGIALMDDPQVLDAFRIANRAMSAAARQRFGVIQGKDPADVDPPAWRPFQLAFLLMNMPGVVDPTHSDREVVDLLFFPAGGGKTEAYLGLAAFTLVLRRLRNPGLSSAGVSVLMRYTLRLLTLDQLSRAATLICALELERQNDESKLGEWPFEIGLWVGQAATPNRMGTKEDRDPYTARAKTIAFKNDDRKPSPIPLEECPWCGAKFSRTSFRLLPDSEHPTDLRIGCANRRCKFTRDQHLPILAVDEPIYRRLPAFLIATVDKFAAMPWTGEVGAFFGRVDRADKNGFYGPCDPGVGRPLDRQLLPPDLVIQDELHLISGPLGTIVGLYETALDELCSRELNNKTVRPKIIASTATVRRADDQIRALFCRRVVDIFPPPGPDLRDSYFAITRTVEESHARCYVGIAAQGRSLKVVLLRTSLALLGAAQKAYKAEGGRSNKENAADPYMTLVGYFNSLRELGGSRRIIEDEVSTRLEVYSIRRREGEMKSLFADRKIAYDIVELTSRVSTDKVAEAKRRLGQPFHEKDRVDVAIATNMISVGLDITRLGLMVVLGQPKTSAEYIQATSRVGRDRERPGLIVTLLNIHRPRDRSHYERFSAYHDTFYRNVEVTSVTPFSPRALDRGLAGVVVALARQGHEPMTPPKGAREVLNERGQLNFVADKMSERAANYKEMSPEDAESLRQQVRDRTLGLLDSWKGIADKYHNQGVELQYQREIGGAQRLLYEFLHPDLKQLPSPHEKFRANRSMRDVEPSVNLWMKTLDDIEVVEDE